MDATDDYSSDSDSAIITGSSHADSKVEFYFYDPTITVIFILLYSISFITAIVITSTPYHSYK